MLHLRFTSNKGVTTNVQWDLCHTQLASGNLSSAIIHRCYTNSHQAFTHIECVKYYNNSECHIVSINLCNVKHT